MTDVSLAHDGHTVDQVISLRYPAYAVRHDRHVVWLNHRMREYYDLWDQFARRLVVACADQGTCAPQPSFIGRIAISSRRCSVASRSRRRFKRDCSSGGASRRKSCTRHRPCAPIATMGTATTCFAVSRLTPLKRFDLLLRALAEPVAHHVRCCIAGEGSEAEPLIRLAVSSTCKTAWRSSGALTKRGCWTTMRGAAPWCSRRSTKTTAS